MTVRIRDEQMDDVWAIRELLVEAFPTDDEARLVELLRGANRLDVSMVAELDGRVVGHIAFSPVTIDGVDAGGAGLAPVAVRPDFHGRGVGTRLIRAGLEETRQAGHSFCVVLGEPAYYTRFGFAPASKWGLTNEYGVADEFMAMQLVADSLVTPGLVRYSLEFNEL